MIIKYLAYKKRLCQLYNVHSTDQIPRVYLNVPKWRKVYQHKKSKQIVDD